MRRRSRIHVMLRMPEMAAVVSGAIARRAIEDDVRDVRRELAHRRPPARVAGLHESRCHSRDRVVLIVVVRDQAVAANGFMVSVDLAEMAPAILVDDLAALAERRVAGNDAINQVIGLLLCAWVPAS